MGDAGGEDSNKGSEERDADDEESDEECEEGDGDCEALSQGPGPPKKASLYVEQLLELFGIAEAATMAKVFTFNSRLCVIQGGIKCGKRGIRFLDSE